MASYTDTPPTPRAAGPLERLVAPHEPSVAVTALLWFAAVLVAVGGYEHAHLYHQGYSQPSAIGVLFVLNAIGSIAAVVLLALRRPAVFAAVGAAICAGSILGVVLSHSSAGLFGLKEGGWTSDAKLTIAVEIVAVLVIIAAVVVDRRRLLPPADRPEGASR